MTGDGVCIGIDLGTSGCRAIAIDADACVLQTARRDLPASLEPGPGKREQDPAAWWSAVRGVLGDLDAATRRRVCAVAVDGTSGSLLLCDRHGRPLTPALMYDDRRATRQAQRVAAGAPGDRPVHGPGSALARCLYLLETIDQRQVAHVLHQADWINGRLTGRYGVADENNVLKLGYDPVSRTWPDWLADLDLPAGLLPDVRPVGAPLGRIDPASAQALGLPVATRVVAGTTDSNAAAIAAGIERTGEAVTSLGSTLVLKVLAERPVNASRYGVYSHRIGDRWLVGGASNSGGRVLRQYFSDRQLRQLSARIDARHPSGLAYYPLPAPGERFPHADPQWPPRLTPRPADDVLFLQGLLEGIAEIEASGYRRLAELGAPYPTRVFSSGGGAGNAVWQAIRADRLGVPVMPALHTEAAYGAALVALRGASTP